MREVCGNGRATTVARIDYFASDIFSLLPPLYRVQVIETLIERKDLSEQQAEDALGVSEHTSSCSISSANQSALPIKPTLPAGVSCCLVAAGIAR
jgi:hypothetical protein